MDSLRAEKKPVKKNVSKKVKKIVINVDNSDENADWIKRVKVRWLPNEAPNINVRYVSYHTCIKGE